MKKALLLTLIFSSIFSSSPTVAQLAAAKLNPRINHTTLTTAPEKIKPLTIGDEVPDIEFAMVNYPSTSARLSDFEGKLVIIDFWSTYCAACIYTFPKIDSLQQRYKDKVQFILVNAYNTGDNEAKIIQFFKRRKNTYGLPFQLATAINDSVAVKFFPHKEIPHYAWIGPNGKLRAITSSKQVTAKNIQKILDDESTKMPLKKDFFPDKLMDFPEDITVNDLAHYSVFRKGRIEGLSVLTRQRIVKTVTGRGVTIRGIAMRNVPLLDIYKKVILFNREYKKLYTDKKLVLEMNDSTPLIFDSSKITRNEWEKENLYTYDVIVPASETDSLYNYMLQDLNRYSGHYGQIEKRKIICLALVRTSSSDKIKADAENSTSQITTNEQRIAIINLPVSQLVQTLDLQHAIKPIVVDETGYTGNITIELPLNLNSLGEVRKILQQYDLDLVETEREMEMFVLKVKKMNSSK